MEAFVKNLQIEVQAKLDMVDPKAGPVKGYDKKIVLVEWAITQLKQYLAKHSFADKATEIKYFKYWCPPFFKFQIYFTCLYDLERIRITAPDNEKLIAYLKKKKKRIDRFLEKHRALRLYFRMEQQDKDEQLFIRTPPTKKENFLTADHYFCKNTICLSKIMAYEEYLPVLISELNEAGRRTIPVDPGNGQIALPRSKYQWKPTPTQTEEIIYSFAKMKCISVDGQDADIKGMVTFFKEVFNIEIGNVYDVHNNSKKRKKDKSPYLNALRDAYLNSG
jgi:hypothetical protein